MAWQEVTPIAKTRNNTRGVQFSMSGRSGAIVSLAQKICDALGWSSRASFKVWLGGGEQAGKLRLLPDPTGPLQGSPIIKGGMRINLLQVPGFVPQRLKRRSVAFAVEDKALVITVPAEVLARPAPVPAARVEPPAPRLSSPPPAGAMYRTGGKIDVSEKIVGRNGGGGR